MELEIRPTTRTEDMYTYTQSQQIRSQTGCIGHLRADMDSNGTGFFSSWEDHRGDLKTDIFKAEFDDVINALRFDSRYGDVLKDRSSLARYCWSQPSARMESDEENYGFRVDTDNYTYATPSLAQAIKLKRFSQDGKLTNEVIESIMSEEKPNQREKINIKYAEARRFIPASIPYEKTGEYILKALEYYHRYQERQKSRNDAR